MLALIFDLKSPMPALLILANKLASPELPQQKIVDGLRVLGYRASLAGLKKVLKFSSELEPAFQELRAAFPGAKRILMDFQQSKNILSALDSTTDFSCDEFIRSKYTANPFCSIIGNRDFHFVSLHQDSILVELIAFFWLIHSSIHTYSTIFTPDKLAKLLDFSLDFTRYVSIVAEDHPELMERSPATLKDSLPNWIEFAGTALDKFPTHPLSTEEIRGGLLEACTFLSQLNSPALLERTPPSDIEVDIEPEETPHKETQRESMLSERERLNIHHNAFQESEIKSIAASIRSILELAEFSLSSQAPQFYFEALITAIALSTGRTIRSAIEFPLSSNTPERIMIAQLVGFKGIFNYPIWTRSISPGVQLILPLPAFLRCLTRQPIRFNDADTLEDCLPYSLVPWEDRCFEWLDSLISLSKHRLNRRIRDALARSIYQDSANSALLNWIATPIQSSSRKLESLSHYLDPLSERTADAYSAACSKVFNKYGAPKEARALIINKEFGITPNEHDQISQLFLRSLQSTDIKTGYISYHNSLALYLLMLLVISTGHRKSKTPFFFSWDILTSENLAFISDKITVGSEARFVPIPAWISKLIEGYRLHLLDLSIRIKSASPELANSISLSVLAGSTNEFRNKPSSPPALPLLGQFFTIDDNLKGRTITTRDLEKFYKQFSSKGIGYFRKSVANSLWSQGLSGHQIEAFLGHNGEMHAFGESSAWSIVKWSKQVREAQERYLSRNGWKEITIRTIVGSTTHPIPITPCIKKSAESYEGRSLAGDAARANARQIIRDLLPSEWFTSNDSTISNENVAELIKAAQERLSDDPESCEKVRQAIAEEINRIRKTGCRISSTLANLTRTEPSPISILSSRHFAIASRTRAWLLDRLGSYADDPSEAFIDRLAAIGLCLVVFDAVLDKSTWDQLLSAIANHEARSARGCLVVRAQIKKTSRVFDKSLILSPFTAAQVAGLEIKHHLTMPSSQTMKAVSSRIVKWLKSAPHTGESLSLVQLFTVFRAWWLPRLSGTEFAIAIGNYSGPAPDTASECALYGIKPSDSVSTRSTQDDIKSILAKPSLSRSSAKAKINNLLSDAEGIFERKEQTSRRQRNTLLHLLRDDDQHSELKALASQKPIVAAILGFLQHLLDDGGLRVKVYRFGSIRTYLSHIIGLIDTWWDCNLDDLETEDFDKAYSSLLNASPQSAFPIWLFHKLLRETRDAPHTTVTTSYERFMTQCRSSIITTKQFEEAWIAMSRLKDDGQLINHTKTFMGVSYQYALRTREALGLELSHVVTPRPFGIRVERNSIRDLKTKGASLRLTQPLLTNTKYQKYFGSVVALCEKSPVKNSTLFSDLEIRNSIYSRSKINQATTSVLRGATGNLSVVPYSMRHSAATRLAHCIFRSPRRIPISSFVEEALVDEIDINSITACFNEGFNAWPFWTDRASMFLGHTSVDTLLNTYWHSSHVRLAEQTWHASEGIHLTNQQLASMLGKDRSSITTQFGRLKKENPDKTIPQEALIIHYIENSKIPELGSDFRIDQKHRTSRMPSESHITQDGLGSWITFHRLLCSRLEDSLTIDDTIKLSERFNLPKTEATAFMAAYESIVRENGFDDFEPSNSQLTIGKSKRNSGVQRGAEERERGIAAAQRLSLASDTFASHLEEFTDIWIERTDPAAPWFVALDVRELGLIIEILFGVGVTRSQLDFISCNFVATNLNGVLTKPELTNMKHQTSRVSAGPRNARVCEFGVRVKQQQGSKIGDYRDTHRLALVLSAIIRSKRFHS